MTTTGQSTNRQLHQQYLINLDLTSPRPIRAFMIVDDLKDAQDRVLKMTDNQVKWQENDTNNYTITDRNGREVGSISAFGVTENRTLSNWASKVA